MDELLPAEEYVCERFRAMADSLVELYHGANANTRGYYDTDLETFAIFTKSAINLARQVCLQDATYPPLILTVLIGILAQHCRCTLTDLYIPKLQAAQRGYKRHFTVMADLWDVVRRRH